MTRWPIILLAATASLFAPVPGRAQDSEAVDRLLQPASPLGGVPNPVAVPGPAPMAVPGMPMGQPAVVPGIPAPMPQGRQMGGFQQQFFPPPGASAQPTAAAPGTAAGGQPSKDAQFERALREVVPLSPDQVTKYRRAQDRVRRATNMPIGPENPVTRSVRLTLKPGERSPVIHVKPGSVTSLTFSDVTGAPWPVLAVTSGNPQVYDVKSAGEEGKTNIIMVSAKEEWYPSNAMVTLVGHPVPIGLQISPEGADLDYRVDIGLMARGPNAAQDVVGVSNLAPTNDLTVAKFLDGVPPEGARRMDTSSPDVEAWRYEDVMYLRTRGDVLSPQYTARSSSVSGVHVFTMAEVPVVMISTDGRLADVRVTR